MQSSGANVIILRKCYHLLLSCDGIIWDDNTPLFIFPENFTHSVNTVHTVKNRYGDLEMLQELSCTGCWLVGRGRAGLTLKRGS
jgi:hypothetical protein